VHLQGSAARRAAAFLGEKRPRKFRQLGSQLQRLIEK